MNDYAQVGQVSALLAIIAGLLLCFWGYRVLKLSLGIIGFVVGASGGWALGMSLGHDSAGIAFVGAILGGLIGMVLCLWVYFLGIFLLGAAAGTIVAAAFSSGTAHQLQPILYIGLPIAFGVIAILVQKFMIIVSTAFSGAYLVTAGIWPFAAGDSNPSRIWLHPAHQGSPGSLGYGALFLWVLLALLGIGSQLRARPKPAEVEGQKK